MSSKISKIFKRLQCSLYVKPWHFHPRSPAIIGRPNVFEDHAQVTEPLTWTRDCMALPRPLSAMVPWWLWKGTWDLDKFIRFRFRKEKTMQSGSKWKLLGCPDCNRLGDARIAPLPARGVSVREKVKNNADWFITSFQEVLVPCRNSRACDGLWRFLAN